jgi:acetylornithine/N-succinyldiaminopimelate aminotransferase
MTNSEMLPIPETQAAEQRLVELERQYVLQTYARYPLTFIRGKGCYLYDIHGKRYLDLLSGIGVNALGHAHPRITKVIREQVGVLIHTSNLYYHEFQGKLAKKLAETTGLERTFFCNSGAEAMEGALKMVKAHGHKIDPSKFEVVALDNSFHGRTLGALSITGQPKYRKDFEPLVPGARWVMKEDQQALEAAVGPQTAGIVIEVIQGEGGVYPVSAAFLTKARELADRFDALLVFDEIQCGVGRPGTYFAYQAHHPVILPDIVALAKPISCGLPLGAIVANQRAASAIAAGMHGSTFGGNALACRVSLEFFALLDELLPQIRRVSGYFRAELEALSRSFPFVREVRCHGLMIGVEMEMPCKQMVTDAMEEGLLVNCTHDVVLRMLPPYILTEKEVDRAIRGLRKVFKKAARG